MTHYRRALEQARPLGPDRTPLVHRVLLGLACGAILAACFLFIWWAIARHR